MSAPAVEGRPIVAVLLPTYNGEKYLPPLLDSLEAQEAVRVRLHTLDDGSSDRSRDVVDSRRETLGVRRIHPDRKLGVPEVFLELMLSLNQGYDYVAYCDQDDIWEPSRLHTATRALDEIAGPALHACAVAPMGDGSSDIPPSWMDVGEVHKGLERLVLGNPVPGCTMTLNRTLVDLLRGVEERGAVVAHDWWTLLVAAVAGRIVVEPAPLVRYRIHTNNTVGIPSTATERMTSLIRSQLDGGAALRVRQLESALRTAGARAPRTVSTLSARALRAAVSGNAVFGAGLSGYLESVGRAVALRLVSIGR